jgi:hypothetical protein
MYISKLSYTLFLLFILFLPLPASGTVISAYQLLLLSGVDTDQKVFIIGDSTVHRHATDYLLNTVEMTYGPDNPDGTQQGWGDELQSYMKYPENSINKARQGANTEEFLTEPDDTALGIDRNWESTEQMIMEAGGGILLIQFGSRNENRLDPDAGIRETKFKQNIGF